MILQRVQAWNNAKLQGKYMETLVGFVFLFSRRFIPTLTWQTGPQLHPAPTFSTNSPCPCISPYYPHLPKTGVFFRCTNTSLLIHPQMLGSTASRYPGMVWISLWSKVRLQATPLHWRRWPGLKELCAGTCSIVHIRCDVSFTVWGPCMHLCHFCNIKFGWRKVLWVKFMDP